MRALVAIADPHVRDALCVAFRAFPGVSVETALEEEARHLLRRRRFDVLAASLRSDRREGEKLVEEARHLLPDLEIVAVTPRSALAVRRADKSKHRLFALLGVPLDPVGVYATIRRLLDRLTTEPATPAAPAAGRAGSR